MVKVNHDATGVDDFVEKNVANNTNPSWWKDPSLRGLMWRCTILLGGQYINGYDGAVMNSFFSVPAFLTDFGNPDSSMQGLMSGAISLGYLIGLIPASIASDKFGRRLPQMFGCSIVIVGTLVQVFKYNSPWAFFGARMIVGFGASFPLIAGSSHVLEVAHPRHQAALTSGFASVYSVGAILAAWVSFGCLNISGSWSWRVPAMLQMLGAVVQITAMPFIPESPRWLASVGRVEEAHQVLAKWHANGKMDDELVLVELSEIEAALKVEQDKGSKSGWSDWVKGKPNRYRLFMVIMIAIMSQWAGSGIISFYLAAILKSVGISSPAQIEGIQAGISMATLAFSIPLSMYIKYVKRRTLWLWSTATMLVCYSIITACSAEFSKTENPRTGQVVIAFIYFFNLAYQLGYGALYYTYMLALLPHAMRTQGVALSLIVGYAMAFFNQYVNPIAFNAIGWYYYFVYLGLLLCYGVIIYFLFPETMGMTPEESGVLLDGGAHVDNVKNAAFVAEHVVVEDKDSSV